MWQLLDIAYVIPAAVFIGYWIGKYLETKYDGDYFVNSVLIGAACGLVLTIVKIKRFVDESNRHCEESRRKADDVAIQSNDLKSKAQEPSHRTPTDQESQ